MKRAALVLGAALALASCGSGEPPGATDDQARSLAADAAKAVDELTEETERLSGRIAELEDVKAISADRLDAVTERLWGSLSNLRSSLADLRGESDDALAQANQALAEAQQAVRDLAVLDSRLDYHLRQEHGGG
jgi:hypothetical protein